MIIRWSLVSKMYQCFVRRKLILTTVETAEETSRILGREPHNLIKVFRAEYHWVQNYPVLHPLGNPTDTLLTLYSPIILECIYIDTPQWYKYQSYSVKCYNEPFILCAHSSVLTTIFFPSLSSCVFLLSLFFFSLLKYPVWL